MRDSLQPGRRFSEKEIGLILKRASELQVQDPVAGPSPDALAERVEESAT